MRGTKTILENREHKKTNFRFLGNRGTSQFISGEQGNRYPLGGPLIWPSVYNERLAITHQHPINHVEAADSITVDMFLIIIVSTVFYVLSRRKIELRDSPRLPSLSPIVFSKILFRSVNLNGELGFYTNICI